MNLKIITQIYFSNQSQKPKYTNGNLGYREARYILLSLTKKDIYYYHLGNEPKAFLI